MNIRKIKLGLSALALSGAAVAVLASQGLGISAFAADAPSAKKAAAEAKAARKALAKRQGDKAVHHAELAVANDPANGAYRALLGQAYLLAGRFASAAQALGDASALNPQDGAVALNLSLAKIAQGDWAGARATLSANAERIPASDRGLAFALAGDPVTAVDILMPAARDASATAKTRQNLALAMALTGRWKEAAEIASMDMSPDQLQTRIAEWMQFARPTNAYDQVAALLNVRPVEDAGQPVALALSQQPDVAVAAAAPAASSVDQFMPGMPSAAAVAEAAPVEAPAEAAPEPVQVAGTGAQVVLGARSEMVQPVAAPRPAPARVAKPVRVARAAAEKKPAVAERVARRPGNYVVQLGAYPNAAVARDGWARYARRVPALAGVTPQGMNVSTRAGNFYRLSVGGFARQDAASLCGQVRARGGNCFVRAQAGDQVAAWVKGGTQVASR
ncbi:SPOR domain-containing protein [Sphingomonas xinjiangensis]|uniref:Flp pilus assembly protein TadD n=1 Tax=Sphingomonas xinjiangensis TaxID=643568 RepID=A0A840Y6A9_9SPHN|nr:SPOR domain-containing protein [Sphingomonas xinjiangensis]MBB5708807.1 Flp pilus assembly protein TadD [Sphingomonas xinjiangensis]